MLFIKDFIYFLLLHLVIASPQINLHLTDWINENTGDNVLQHDCLHVAHSTEIPLSHQIISYCLSESPSQWNIQTNTFNQIFTFDELGKQNITSEQLYHWSAPMDVIERYQLYLNQLSIVNVSSGMGSYIFYNCTLPRFGPQCQYSLEIDASNSHVSLNEMIDDYYRYQSSESETLTCYIHLQCDRGSKSICLDWSEICDGKVDCSDGTDEENCRPLMYNQCKNGEYRCDNGQCIPETFVNDSLYAFDCLDRSDEYQTSLIPSQYEYDVPTFEKEDVICSWHEGLTNYFVSSHPLTSSCVLQRHSIIEQAVFSDVSIEISARCLLAIKCHSNIPTYDNPLCEDLCENKTCIQMISYNCPDIFYYPNVPIVYGHIYFAYTRAYLLTSDNSGQIPPEYICYDDQLCNGFNPNSTILLFKGKTCRHPKDFPLSFGTNRRNWYSHYVLPLYSQLSHCNRMVQNNSAVFCDKSTMYQCKNSSKCIPKSYVGDEIRDCAYNDDEEQTTINELCLTDQLKMFFKCPRTKDCIRRNQVEDGVCNCGRDEYGICDDEDLKSNEMKGKIRFSTTCDSFVDLLPITIDGRNQTDETDCEQWPCNNTYTRCDGVWNCLDGADEIDCNPTPLIQCPSNHHICLSSETEQPMCLPIVRVNDGIIDCIGGLDEPTFCPLTDRFDRQRQFYCIISNLEFCIPSKYVCDGTNDCTNGEDERFCNSAINNVHPNNPRNSDAQKLFDGYFDNTLKPKSTALASRATIINQAEQNCRRGLPLRVWLDTNTNLSTTTCLCPPSYYGVRCQYQNQRVSLSMQLKTSSDSQQTPFVLIISLIDDSVQRIIHSYQQLTYLHLRDQHTKFNVYLLYSTRPKSLTKQYSVHIDIYERITLHYRGSLRIPLEFPFLPVERVAVQINIPPANNIVQTCLNRQCVHGDWIQYLNDPKRTSFCRCQLGWTGQSCTIPHMCTCSSDSLCVGVAANNRSICVCPMNKFGSRCLLTQTICQSGSSDGCLNGGICLASDEQNASLYPFVCICPKGFSGDRCEIPDTKIIVSFHPNIVLPSRSFVFFDFIHLSDETVFDGNTSWQIICGNETSLIGYWSRPFHIAFIELLPFQYYLIIHQKMYHQSSTIAQTINPSDRCRSVNEIFHENITHMHLLRRIKYYHAPCQNRSLNLSCFYDDVYMCLCNDLGGQRLANCFEFNHQKKLDDFDFDKEKIERACSSDYLFNSSTSTSSPASSTSTSSPASSTSSSSPVSPTSSSSSVSSTSSSSPVSSTSSSSPVSSTSSSSPVSPTSSSSPVSPTSSSSPGSSTAPIDSGVSAIHPRELLLCLFMLLFCFI